MIVKNGKNETCGIDIWHTTTIANEINKKGIRLKIFFVSFLLFIPNINVINIRTNENAIVAINPLPPVKFNASTVKPGNFPFKIVKSETKPRYIIKNILVFLF